MMALLGISHVERNGHHYYRRLSMLPASWQRAVLEAHGDIYRPHQDGFACLHIEDGRLDLRSVNAAPFGSRRCSIRRCSNASRRSPGNAHCRRSSHRPGRNFVTLKLVTEDGVHGLGDATLNGRELAVASYLTDHVLPLLINRDAGSRTRGGNFTRGVTAPRTGHDGGDRGGGHGPVGHRREDPERSLIELLGGASRDRVMVYAHANGKTLDDTVAAAYQQKLGYKAIRAQCGIPGIEHAHGIAKGIRPTSLPRRGASGDRLEQRGVLAFVPSVFERLRKEFGEQLHLLHDVHHRLTPIEAGRLGRALEPHRLFWMEDPVPAEVQESFRLIRQHTTTPIAVGEVFNSIYDCYQLIEEELIDYIRTTVTHAGGISHLRKIAARELHHVRTGSRRDRSQPGLHGGSAALRPERPQLRSRSTCSRRGLRSGVPARLLLSGRIHAPGNAPGLGVDIDEVLAATVLRARALAGQSEDRWDVAFLVTTSNNDATPRHGYDDTTTRRISMNYPRYPGICRRLVRRCRRRSAGAVGPCIRSGKRVVWGMQATMPSTWNSQSTNSSRD